MKVRAEEHDKDIEGEERAMKDYDANNATMDWLRGLYDLAGLPTLEGQGRYPPVLSDETRWAIEHLRKYPEPGKDDAVEKDWTMIDSRSVQDSLFFI